MGTTNEPLVEPLVGAMNGWVCSAWWKSTCHVNALAGSVAVLGVGARAREVDRLAAAVERRRRRREIVAVGAWFEVTVSVAALLVAVPGRWCTRARKRAPLSAGVTVASV